MLDFNMLVFKKASYKYILYNILCILLNVLMIFFIKDEPGEESQVLLIVCLSQIITFFRYLITRTAYRDDLLERKNDGIHIFIETKRARWKVFKYKLLQLFIFNFIQVLFSFLILFFIISSKTEFALLIINLGIGLIITFVTFLFDFIYVNQMNKNIIEEWFGILVYIMPFGIFYYPKYYLIIAYIVILAFSILINLRRIWRNL